MAATLPSDIYDPAVIMTYLDALTDVSNAFWRSGIVANRGNLTRTGSSVLTQNQWAKGSAMQRLTPGNDITAWAMSDATRQDPLIHLVNQCVNTKRAVLQAGEYGDPNQAAAGQVSMLLDEARMTTHIRMLEGATDVMSTNDIADTGAEIDLLDITALEAVFGDMQGEMMGGKASLVMKTAKKTVFRNLGLVTAPTVGLAAQDSIIATGMFETILGHPVIVTDLLYQATTATTGDYYTYLVKNGAMFYRVNSPVDLRTTYDEDKLAYKITWDMMYYCGIDGISFSETPAAATPSDTDLRTSTNYTVVYESEKNCGNARIQTS